MTRHSSSDNIDMIVQLCLSTDGYDGLSEFAEICELFPDEAFHSTWSQFRALTDRGRGVGLAMLLEVLACHMRSRVLERMSSEWSELTDTQREALISSASFANVAPLDFWLKLFNAEASTTRDRHLIVAGLASGEHAERFRPIADKYVHAVGEYEDSSSNATLDDFVRNLKANYLN